MRAITLTCIIMLLVHTALACTDLSICGYWKDKSNLASDGENLYTIGANTVNHFKLKTLEFITSYKLDINPDKILYTSVQPKDPTKLFIATSSWIIRIDLTYQTASYVDRYDSRYNIGYSFDMDENYLYAVVRPDRIRRYALDTFYRADLSVDISAGQILLDQNREYLYVLSRDDSATRPVILVDVTRFSTVKVPIQLIGNTIRSLGVANNAVVNGGLVGWDRNQSVPQIYSISPTNGLTSVKNVAIPSDNSRDASVEYFLNYDDPIQRANGVFSIRSRYWLQFLSNRTAVESYSYGSSKQLYLFDGAGNIASGYPRSLEVGYLTVTLANEQLDAFYFQGPENFKVYGSTLCYLRYVAGNENAVGVATLDLTASKPPREITLSAYEKNIPVALPMKGDLGTIYEIPNSSSKITVLAMMLCIVTMFTI